MDRDALMASIPMLNTLAAVEVIMEKVDQDEFIPTPQVGETVLEYWLRVLQYQAYDRALRNGGVDYASREAGHDVNPYRTKV